MKPSMARRIGTAFALAALLSSGAWAHKGGKHGTKNAALDAKKNPYAGNADAVEAGRKSYGRYCGGCHGGSAQGAGKNPGLITAAKKDSAGKLFDVITHGVVDKGMPAWPQLPEKERWQIVTYLQSLK
jgi:mono/diheme cytochrome c family protein